MPESKTPEHRRTVLKKKPKKPAPDDARKFNPIEHDFPADPNINPALEKKLDIIISYLYDILKELQNGFGCLIPLMLGMLFLLAAIAGLLAAMHALLAGIFAMLAFWTVHFLVKRVIFGQPITRRLLLMSGIWFIVWLLILLLINYLPTLFPDLIP